MRQDAAIRGPIVQAVRVSRDGVGGARHDFTYCVIETSDRGDKRSMPRRRTRLRSGKVLDPRNAFLIECQIYDRSGKGARIRLLADIPVPNTIRLYEDSPERLIDAIVVWRRDREIGLCFAPSAQTRKITQSQLTHLRGRYYAIGARTGRL